ncbi:hypothetical protein Ahu01nite_004380 [Winogradskya humida]|uniref:Uncharacterized protein n=1 Tax=Winogradskya humida TaxID=113566 RepID=A0ABQ3ZFI2_9ACTN|nr:hypothetical protein [Actinoplanes humidus]GIE17336.1 hypothetical protein Ahu01nite_004380 [Actinoplanes humidus]
MTSVAGARWGLVFWERDGRAYASGTGPETRTGTAPVPEGATFTGIEFALGTSLRAVPTPALVDGGKTADVVAELGYFDEPHLARALRTYVGRTVRQLREGAGGAIALDLGQRPTS